MRKINKGKVLADAKKRPPKLDKKRKGRRAIAQTRRVVQTR